MKYIMMRIRKKEYNGDENKSKKSNGINRNLWL